MNSCEAGSRGLCACGVSAAGGERATVAKVWQVWPRPDEEIGAEDGLDTMPRTARADCAAEGGSRDPSAVGSCHADTGVPLVPQAEEGQIWPRSSRGSGSGTVDSATTESARSPESKGERERGDRGRGCSDRGRSCSESCQKERTVETWASAGAWGSKAGSSDPMATGVGSGLGGRAGA
jgi:hypothetical protein